MAEELSQEDIDSLFSSSDESDREKGTIEKFSSILNSSFEEVLRTALNLDVVVKLIDVGKGDSGDVGLEDGGVMIKSTVSVDDRSASMFLYLKTRFATILSDLMLMGPGNPKEEIEEEDLDALKELFSQILGNLSISLKDEFDKNFSAEVVGVGREITLPDSDVYRIKLDVAVPNVETDTITILSGVDEFDSVFSYAPGAEGGFGAETNEPVETVMGEHEQTAKRPSEPQERIRERVPSSGTGDVRNLDLILDIDLDVEIRIGQKEMLIRDLLKVNEGSIIELDRSIEEPLEVVVNGKVIARGIVVVVGGHFGIKITSIETREERVKSLGEA